MDQKKISLNDYERLDSFAAAVNDVQYTLSMLNHHIEVLKRTGDVDALLGFNKSLCVFLGDVVTDYKRSLSDE